MKSLFQCVAVLAVLFVIAGFALGWMTYQQSGEKATIEIDTGKILDSADEAVKMGRELLHETAREQPAEEDEAFVR